MPLKLNVRDTLQSLHDHNLTASARIALDDLLQEVAPDDEFPIDLGALLAERKEIAVIWAVEDVQEVRPDLTEDQAWEVLKTVKRHHDACYGICWETLEVTAQILFGDEPETDEA